MPCSSQQRKSLIPASNEALRRAVSPLTFPYHPSSSVAFGRHSAGSDRTAAQGTARLPRQTTQPPHHQPTAHITAPPTAPGTAPPPPAPAPTNTNGTASPLSAPSHSPQHRPSALPDSSTVVFVPCAPAALRRDEEQPRAEPRACTLHLVGAQDAVNVSSEKTSIDCYHGES